MPAPIPARPTEDGDAGMVIIGAGECGTRAALALREAGYDGPVTLIGAEPHPPYERPPLSKDAITAETPAPKTIGGAERLAEAGIDFRPVPHRRRHRPRRAAPSAAPTARRSPTTACCSPPAPARAPLPLPGADGPTRDDAAHPRRRRPHPRRARPRPARSPSSAAASSASSSPPPPAGSAPRSPSSRRCPASSPAACPPRSPPRSQAAPRRRGRHASTSARGIAAITESRRRARRRHQHPGRPRRRRHRRRARTPSSPTPPASPLDNGIAVDATLATSDPAIFAAGDCCSFPQPLYDDRRVRLESWRSAQEQGSLAARNMLGAAEPVSAVPWFWSDQYDLVAADRRPRRRAPTTRCAASSRDGAFVLFHLAPDGRLLAASGIGPGNAVAKDIRLAEMMIARAPAPRPRRPRRPGDQPQAPPVRVPLHTTRPPGHAGAGHPHVRSARASGCREKRPISTLPICATKCDVVTVSLYFHLLSKYTSKYTSRDGAARAGAPAIFFPNSRQYSAQRRVRPLVALCGREGSPGSSGATEGWRQMP